MVERRTSNPKSLGSIPWRSRVKDSCFLSLRVNSGAHFFLSCPPPFVCTALTQMCAHVKDPVSICRKRTDLTVGGMGTGKHCTHENKYEKMHTKKAAQYHAGIMPPLKYIHIRRSTLVCSPQGPVLFISDALLALTVKEGHKVVNGLLSRQM